MEYKYVEAVVLTPNYDGIRVRLCNGRVYIRFRMNGHFVWCDYEGRLK